jgi:hypothetical protein
MEQNKLDFDIVIESLTRASTRAQTTFMYRLINTLGPALCRTIIRYAYERLDRYNASLPDGDSNKERFRAMARQHKTFITEDEINKPGIDGSSFKLIIPNEYIRGPFNESL